MDVDVDISNIADVCRLCLSLHEPRSSVFGDQAPVGSAVSLATKIQVCLSIEIQSSDKVSTSICSDCCGRVDKWHTYREQCLRSQQKLQAFLKSQSESKNITPGTSNSGDTCRVGTIKSEPEDFCEPASPGQTVPLTSDDDVEDAAGPSTPLDESVDGVKIKREEPDDYIEGEMDSVEGTQLLLNPMAIAGHKEDRLMEGAATQKKAGRPKNIKKRRGPHTHFRGKNKKFRQRCPHCQLNLHSKTSFARHMDRFHSGKVFVRKSRKIKPMVSVMDEELENKKEEFAMMEDDEANGELDVEEMVEDVEDELASLEKDAPLTPVQQNIISQLKTFSCYSCKQTFNDRRSTLNHIRHHMPDLRPYTCIACLTEFADRSIYKLHCGASFQCAMKIALVVPEHGMERYFTCNMCLRSLANRKELLSHLSKHSDKQYQQLMANPYRSPPKAKPVPALTKVKYPGNSSMNFGEVGGPFDNGDPARNHKCSYCGMIYRRRPNLDKHILLCQKVSPEARICYVCVNCNLTFLAFNKFASHVTHGHRRKDLECYHCRVKCKDNTSFLMHYREQCSDRKRYILSLQKCTRGELKKEAGEKSATITCALCPNSSFVMKAHLSEHRKLHHPKLKPFACTLCDQTFNQASVLSAHMADHEMGIWPGDLDTTAPNLNNVEPEDLPNISGISVKTDPGAASTECQTCGKIFGSYTNLRRHIRNAHNTVGRFNCFTCAKTFVHEEEWIEHVEKEHKSKQRSESCPQCPAVFDSRQELNNHRECVHGLNGSEHLACYICGKTFSNEASLKIHRGHHFRVNSRLSVGNVREQKEQSTAQHMPKDEGLAHASTIKSPRARKSFPSPIRSRPPVQNNQLQCQVCDDRFRDVGELRKHLWDVHCARNKPEKSFISAKLQCELCTNVLPDEESLASHMKWHESNPILSNGAGESQSEVQCDVCDKFYSNINSLRKHKKRHKTGSIVANKLHSRKKTESFSFNCHVCRKVFGGRSTLMKHKAIAHPPTTSTPRVKPEIIRPVQPQFDFETLLDSQEFSPRSSTQTSPAKKTVTCSLCRVTVADMRALYKHRFTVHKITIDTMPTESYNFGISSQQQVSCTACSKLFSNASNMRQHYTKVHGPGAVAAQTQCRCPVQSCRRVFKSRAALASHEKVHKNLSVSCPICRRQMLNRVALADHMHVAHKTKYPMANKNTAKPNKPYNLDNYVVKGATGRQCPLCKITYPNHKALKVHYLKVHDV